MPSTLQPSRSLASLLRERRGASAIETAIVLIAFIVVASVFGFVMLSTGVFSAGENKEVVLSGLDSANANILLRGSVTAFGTPPNTVDKLVFYVTNSGDSGAAVNLSNSGDSEMSVRYSDDSQALELPTSAWSAKWVIGSGNLLEPGERVEITVTLTGLATPLGSSSTFNIRLQPVQGSTLLIQRNTPAQLKVIMDLR
ncbi:MAG: hypothetical protein O2854_00100 [Chloroflexi bacterium]|nr:hypothetical protein [Chloroflexota bacterium]